MWLSTYFSILLYHLLLEVSTSKSMFFDSPIKFGFLGKISGFPDSSSLLLTHPSPGKRQ